MTELILLLLSCAVLGALVGFLAGLLGIGGGLVIVPVLSSILLYFAVLPAEQVVIVAIATSLLQFYLPPLQRPKRTIAIIMCRGILPLGL